MNPKVITRHAPRNRQNGRLSWRPVGAIGRLGDGDGRGLAQPQGAHYPEDERVGARGAQGAIDVVEDQSPGVSGHETGEDLEEVLQAGLGIADHEAGEGDQEDEEREEEQQEEVGQLAGESQ